VKEASHLNSLGTQAHKDGKFSESITSFTKATVLPSVADHDRHVFFSNIASSHLTLFEQQAYCSRKFVIDDPTDHDIVCWWVWVWLMVGGVGGFGRG
jgi:hypothetical protein